MEAERRKQILLAVLGVALVVVAVRAWTLPVRAPLPSSNGAAGQAPAARRPKATAATGAPDVHLKALGAERSKPAEAAAESVPVQAEAAAAATAARRRGPSRPPPAAPAAPTVRRRRRRCRRSR